jgi:hypothetical protein
MVFGETLSGPQIMRWDQHVSSRDRTSDRRKSEAHTGHQRAARPPLAALPHRSRMDSV